MGGDHIGMAPTDGRDVLGREVEKWAGWQHPAHRPWIPGDNATTSHCVIVAAEDRYHAYLAALETLSDRHRVIACLTPSKETQTYAAMVVEDCNTILTTLRGGELKRGVFVNWPPELQKIAFRCACRVLRLDTVTTAEVEMRSRP